jgi:acid phosphatase
MLGLSLTLNAQQLGFVFFGDSGTGGSKQYQVAKGIQHYCSVNQCDFGLMLGDNFYPWGVHSVNDWQFETKFVRPYGPLGFRFYVVWGNHDIWGNEMAQIDYTQKNPQWFFPMPFYRFKETKEDLVVEFFAMNTNRIENVQLGFLQKMMDESEADWKIVFGHHPIYSYGSHGDTDDMVEKVFPIIKDKADFYLSGHDHDKQFLKDGDGVYIVSGAAAKLRGTDMGPKSLFAASTYGFAHMLLDEDNVIFKFLDENGNLEWQWEDKKRKKF